MMFGLVVFFVIYESRHSNEILTSDFMLRIRTIETTIKNFIIVVIGITQLGFLELQ